MELSGNLDRENIADVMALTSLQEGMLFHYLKDPRGDFYFEQLSLEISGTVDTVLFEQAWNSVVESNGMLRTVFRWEKMSNPAQVVLGKHRPLLRYHDFFGDNNAQKRLEELKAHDRKEIFNLREVPFRVTLCRIAENEYELVISNHHILYDGWSTGIILTEFFDAYKNLTEGKVPVPAEKTPFKEFVRWNQRQDIEKQEIFWAEYLNGVDWDNRTGIPVKKRKTDVGGSSVFPVSFAPRKKDRLENFVRRHKITTATLFYGAWGLLLQKYTDSSDVIMGTTVSGRSAGIKGIEEIVGLFINTIPLRVQTGINGGSSEDGSILGLLLRLNGELQAREVYENTPLLKIKEYGNCFGKEELFDSIMVIENYPLDIRRLHRMGALRVSSYSMVEATHYDLTAAVGVSDSIDINFIYHNDVFSEAVIRRLSSHFTRIVDGILENPRGDVSEIDMLTAEERRMILEDFNDTGTRYPRDKTIHELFEEQVERVGDNIAVEARGAGPGDEPRRLSYKELNRKSNRLARLLRAGGVRPGTIAGIMMERSVDVVVAVLAILKAGGAYLPIDPEYPDNRIVSMLDSSGARYILTAGCIYEKKSLASLCGNRDIRVIPLDNIEKDLEKESPGNLDPVGGPEDLIYIIFTSGSTGTPKGAGVYHRGFMNLMFWFVTEFELDAGDGNLLITSLSFDLTQKNLYASLIKGGTLYIPGMNYFEPGVLLQEIQRGRVTWINCTPSMFYRLVEYEETVGKEQLSSLRYVFLGGEPISLSGLIRWLESDYHEAQIINTYGPTECTDICAFYRITRPGRFLEETIPVGRPVYNARLFVPGKDLQPLPVGVPGELLIGGDGVGCGYIDDNRLTGAKFIRHSFVPGGPEQLLYRTGDRVKWLPDGTIVFLGRIDNQVKIRGYRIELGEIESLLQSHPHVKEAIVKTGAEGEDGDKYLCAYVVPHNTKTFQVSEPRSFLVEQLPEYMVPSYFVVLEKMPLNPNGKVDRKALPEPEVARGPNYVPPRNETEKLLADLWSGLLGLEGRLISIHDDFFRLGGHSLKAVTLMGRIHKEFSVEIPIGELFQKPTVEGLAHLIDTAKGSSYSAIRLVEKRDYYAVSSAQKRLFVVHGLDPGSVTYNIPAVMALEGKVDKERLESAFKGLIHRHESLRTSFKSIDGQPVQIIHGNVEFKIEYLVSESAGGIDSFIRPFDLSCPPLLRVGLVRTGEDRHLLVFDVHHIVSDGVSSAVLVKEFMALYKGETPPPLPLQYKDFALWQNDRFASGEVVKQGVYWRRRLEGGVPSLNLPTDYLRPTVQKFDGNSILFNIEEGRETEALERLALETGSTLYIVLFAVFNLLLIKLSGREDIVVGTPVAGRRHSDIENIVGMFVNILPVRTSAFGTKRFTDFLEGVRENIFRAFENQECRYEELLENLAVKRDLSRNPLFDTVFVLQNMENQPVEIPGLVLTPMEYNTRTSKFDLTLQCIEEGKGLQFRFEYSTRLFKEETVRRFIDFFKKIISDILENPGVPLPGIEIISETEKRRVLMDFNNTAADYPGDKAIQRLFEEWVERSGDRVALVYGTPGAGSDIEHISYLELNNAADGLALSLKEKGVRSGGIVGIEGDRSADMVLGILAILKAGGVFLPIDADYPDERKRFMLADTNAGVLLSGNSIERIDIRGDDDLPTPTDFAYIMYTSGSTGVPKGVVVTHRNVVRLVQNTDFVPLSPETRVLQTGAPVFDATTFEIWGPLLNGGQLVLAGREVILDAHRLAGVLNRHRVNTLWLSAPLFNQLSQQDEELFGALDYLLVGGDVLSPPHINRVRHNFPSLRVINGYGPTENTTFSCTYSIERDFEGSIPIGRPINNSTAYIVDRYGHVQPVGILGELIVGGDGVAAGYLNNPELTAEKFIRGEAPPNALTPYPSLTSAGTPGPLTPLYKTGDLARWLSNGTIEFFGRIDRQVKIRGFRVETGEIESRLLAHEAVEEAVVIDREHPSGDRYLCAYIVYAGTGPGGREVREYLSQTLPDYMIPTYFVPLDTIPLNPNGKVDHKALPEPAAESGDHHIAPRDEVEAKMAAIWYKILSGKTPGESPGSIGIDENFFQLGGHSLKAGAVISEIHKAFGVKLSLVEIFERPTIRELSQSVKRTSGDIFVSIEPAEKRDYYPLSSPQKRLYLLRQMQKDREDNINDNINYNVSWAAVLEGKPAKDRFEDAFRELVARHESFRTTFEMIDGEAVQIIQNNVEFNIEYYGKKEKMDSFIRPFDLSRAPLLRVGLAVIAGDEHLLMVDMHHIVTDGTSMGIFVGEFMSLYRGEELPPLRLHYKDYAQWQASVRRQELLKEQEIHWLKVFPGEIPILQLPLDFTRPEVQRFDGASLGFELNETRTLQLNELARREDATLFMTLLAVFTVLLSRLSGQEDIIVGSPIAARRHVDLDPIVGMFVNTLALRNYPSGDKSFPRFLTEVKERTLAAFENQDYPFEDLVEKVNVSRDLSRNPLFDTAFVLQNMENQAVEIPGLVLTPMEYNTRTSKFDLTFICEESEEQGTLCFTVDYCTRLFKEETVSRFIGYFERIIAVISNEPRKKISEIDMVSEEEKQRLLVEFNRLEPDYPVDRTIHRLFEQQAEKTPDCIALVAARHPLNAARNPHLTYRRLNELSSQLARFLVERGVRIQTTVGIMTRRSLEMIIGILGILKSGCAYVPLNPEAPAARNGYILEESNTKHLLTTRRLFEDNENVTNWEGEITFIEENPNPSHPLTAPSSHPSSPRDFAYIIFTSGSTGKPKGVPISHSNLSPLLHWGYKHMALETTDRVVQNLSYYFDWSVWEIFITLTSGSSLHMITKEILLDPAAQAEFIRENSITVLNITPTQFQAIVNRLEDKNALLSLSLLNIGAEKLTYDLVERTCEFIRDRCRLYNMYGPTEATIMSAVLEIDKTGKEKYKQMSSVPIGNTIANGDLLVLDPYLGVCPINVTGELYIGGDGLAHGYLNDLGRSPSVFIKNPFETSGIKGKRLYKTGDLVRRLRDGSIEFLGRRDHQVKIRGYRIELGEVENHLLEHDHIKEVAVIDRERENGEKYLCAYIVCEGEGETPVDPRELKTFLSHTLPDYMIPAVFITLARMPLNPNGKIDRKALPVPEGSVFEGEHVSPRDPVETKLAAIWAEVLNTSPTAREISIHADFFEIGGHSLKILQLINAVQKEFNVKLDFQDIFQFPTIAELRNVIRNRETVRESRIPRLEEKDHYPLSYTQQRLWLLYQFDPEDPAFNLPQRITLREPVEETVVRGVFRLLVERHESFRTYFKKVSGEPAQFIRPPDGTPLNLEFVDISHLNGTPRAREREELLTRESILPFTLDQPPLYRIKLIKCDENEHDIVLTMHHIITDGWSMEILEKEFQILYNARKRGVGEAPLTPLPVRYRDYADWHNRLLADSEGLRAARVFWETQLSGERVVLDLPYDFPADDTGNKESAGYRFVVPETVVRDLKTIAQENKASLFMVLMAAYNMLLSRISGQEEILLAIPGAARQHDGLQDIVGLFVNTLILKSRVHAGETFTQLLGRVQADMLRVLDHQSCPLELICKEFKLRYPEISVFFNMSVFGSALEGDLEDMESYSIDRVQNAKFDIVSYVGEYKNAVEVTTHYQKGRFKPVTIERMMHMYLAMLETISRDPGKPLKEYFKTKKKRKIAWG